MKRSRYFEAYYDEDSRRDPEEREPEAIIVVHHLWDGRALEMTMTRDDTEELIRALCDAVNVYDRDTDAAEDYLEKKRKEDAYWDHWGMREMEATGN